MSTTVMPENFLTRYNTTTESCNCPSYIYTQRNIGRECKHIRVLKNPSSYTVWDSPTHVHNYDRSRWLTYASFERARRHNLENSEELVDFVRNRGFHNQGETISSFDIMVFRSWNYLKQVALARYFNIEYRLNVYSKIRNVREMLNIPEITSIWEYTEDYETTHNSCKCKSFHYYPEFFCKHIVEKNNLSATEIHINEVYLSQLQNSEQVPPLVPLERMSIESNSEEETHMFDNIIDSLNQMKILQKQLKEERSLLLKEQEEFRENSSCCNICYDSKSIKCCNVCSGKLCVDCWKKIEDRKRRNCPYCRSEMERLRDVLIKKFKQFQE